jgi:hypothetical protein
MAPTCSRPLTGEKPRGIQNQGLQVLGSPQFIRLTNQGPESDDIFGGNSMNSLSKKILSLSDAELTEYTKKIPNDRYLYTVAMVDVSAQKRLMSVISDKAKALVKRDLDKLAELYLSYWA